MENKKGYGDKMSFWKTLRGIKVAAEAGYKTASGALNEMKSTLTDTKTKFSQTYREMSLDKELQDCQDAAKEGYDLAQAKYDEIKSTLADAENKLSQTNAEQNQVKRIQNSKLVETQKGELQQLSEEIERIGADLRNLHERSQFFSIVVYGRTTAGKSTLMEILTHGNGESIGKGGQRTTLDVRDYFWKGLKITDVPGVCAFGGKIDETTALEAAKAADLILFLIRSDEVQPDEAEKLAQLRSLGKPVLGVINIRQSFNNIKDEDNIKDLEEAMADTENIDATINQFKEFAKRHNQDWSGIKFVATHLLSAYMSQDKNIKVFELSRFAEVEKFILEKVRDDGRFLRIKTFADAIAVPMNKTILKIYEQSGKTLLESDVWLDKRSQLGKWSENFLNRSRERFDNLYEDLSAQLNKAIDEFVKDHYEDEKAGENWQAKFKSLKFDEQYKKFLESLAKECDKKRKDLSDELKTELPYLGLQNQNDAQVSIALDDTTPVGQYLSIAVSAAGFFFAPLAVVGILGKFIFDDKEKMIRENKQKLRDAITEPSCEVLNKMHNQAWEMFNDKIWSKGICDFWNLLAGYQFMLARLGQSQYFMACTLSAKFSELNAKLLKEAISCKGKGSASSVKKVARIPGETLVAFADCITWNLSKKEMSDLLGEDFGVIKLREGELGNELETTKAILGCDIEFDTYQLDSDTEEKEAERALAIVPKNKLDTNSIKFKIAQQISVFPIIQR